MRRYRSILLLVTAVYLLLAAGMYWGMRHHAGEADFAYRVEINRYMERICSMDKEPVKEELEALAAQGDSVRQISYLSAQGADREQIEAFYTAHNGVQTEIVPIGEGTEITAYVRFDYVRKQDGQRDILWSEAALLLLFLLLLGILIYLERRILRPFREMSSLPYELAKGNLSRDLKESRNRYFGKFLWGLGMLKDSLEYHKNQELKLIRDKKMLLLAISHDIKTPVNAINLYAKAMENGIYETEEQRKAAAAHILEKTAEIDGFIGEIVRSSTEEVIAIEVTEGVFYLEELVAKIKGAYQEKCSIHKIRFRIDDFENCLVRGDMDRVYEAVCNLMENAMKYGDGVSIGLSLREEEGCRLLTVSNSGIPVEENEMPHLFESFFRGENAQGRKGNGLGLYICREIMQKCGGDIYAKRHESGMEFVLVLVQHGG